MPPKNSYNLDSGTMFFMNDDGKWEPLCPIKEINIERETYADDTVTLPIITNVFGEIVASVSVGKDLCITLGLIGCPNRRVVHLAKHAKKARVRAKNFKRGVELIFKKGKETK